MHVATKGRRGLRACLAIAVTLTTAACGPEQNPLSVTERAGDLVIAWRTCSNADRDGIVTLSVHPFTPDFEIESPPPPVWQVTAAGPDADPASEVVVGAPVDGFLTVVSLQRPLKPQESYAAIANGQSSKQVLGFVAFRPDDQAEGKVGFDEFRTEERATYFDRDDEDFGCFAS